MCGYVGISFMTFFISTLIGKSVIKVTLQILFIYCVYSYTFQNLIIEYLYDFTMFASYIRPIFKIFGDKVFLTKKQLEKQDLNQPLLKQVWQWFIIVMILYFAISTLNSLVRIQLR